MHFKHENAFFNSPEGSPGGGESVQGEVVQQLAHAVAEQVFKTLSVVAQRIENE